MIPRGGGRIIVAVVIEVGVEIDLIVRQVLNDHRDRDVEGGVGDRRKNVSSDNFRGVQIDDAQFE